MTVVTGKRYYFLDENEALFGLRAVQGLAPAPPWVFVIVEAPTGIVYGNQYGGTSCLQG
jgi:hypothetical protein